MAHCREPVFENRKGSTTAHQAIIKKSSSGLFRQSVRQHRAGSMSRRSKTLVVVGDRAVGKSSLVHRLLEEPVDFTTYNPTIDDNYSAAWKLPNGQMLQLQIVDTAAWNEFPAMQSLFVKMSHLVLIVYDVTSPTWRQSLLDTMEQVRLIKDDADIFVVGNKCDKLTKEDQFSARELSGVIGTSCVGHVYTSALREQGVDGLRQLLLCSKSQLTEGHYTEFAQIPKKKKLKKKKNGRTLGLHQLPKIGKKPKAPVLMADHDPEKYKQPVIHPHSRPNLRLNDLVDGNFDKLFKAAEADRRRSSVDTNLSFNTYLGSDGSDCSALSGISYSQHDHTSYISGTTTPASSIGSPVSTRRVQQRQMRSLDNLHVSLDTDTRSTRARHRSTDSGSHLTVSPINSYCSQSRRSTSPSVLSETSASPQMTRVVHKYHGERRVSSPATDNNQVVEIKDRYHVGRGVVRVGDKYKNTRASEGNIADISKEMDSVTVDSDSKRMKGKRKSLDILDNLRAFGGLQSLRNKFSQLS